MSGGLTVSGSLEQLRQQVLLEWSDVVSWAAAVGVKQLDQFAGDCLIAIVDAAEQNEPNLPSAPDLTAYKVAYREEIALAPPSTPFARDLITRLGGNNGSPSIAKYDSPHLAFTIAMQGLNAGDLKAKMVERLRRPIDVWAMLNRVLTSRSDARRAKEFLQGYEPRALTGGPAIAPLTAELGFAAPADLAWWVEQSILGPTAGRRLDPLGTPAKAKLEAMLERSLLERVWRV